jgi:hypothetical protein
VESADAAPHDDGCDEDACVALPQPFDVAPPAPPVAEEEENIRTCVLPVLLPPVTVAAAVTTVEAASRALEVPTVDAPWRNKRARANISFCLEPQL